MKSPKQCTRPAHQSADYSLYSRDLALARRVRRDSLAQAADCRAKLAQEHDREEEKFLRGVLECAEWTAQVCLEILREGRGGSGEGQPIALLVSTPSRATVLSRLPTPRRASNSSTISRSCANGTRAGGPAGGEE